MKFKYDYLNNRLWWRIQDQYSYEISEDQQFRTNYGNFGGDGFILGNDNHWITFTIYPQKIRVFYKQPNKAGEITYFRKDIPLTHELTAEDLKTAIYPSQIEFEFADLDQVEKINGIWKTKQS